MAPATTPTQASARHCPKCAARPALELRVVEDRDASHRVDMDVCPRCLGVWLDPNEPQQLWELREFLFGLTTSAHVQEDLRRGDCPACADHPPMTRHPVGAFGVDRCRACGGVWFDGGELAPCLTQDGYRALLRTLQAAWKSAQGTRITG